MTTIQINGTIYTQLGFNRANEVITTVQHRNGERKYFNIPFSEWHEFTNHASGITGANKLTVPALIASICRAEILLNLPFMELCGKLVRFTNIVLSEGYETVYLVIDKEGNYHFLSSVYEPNCDGAYISNDYTETLTKDYSEYQVIYRDGFSDKDLTEAIYTLNS